jgi:ABC-type transport system involved in multi-copper enzyme maturation permease subunit
MLISSIIFFLIFSGFAFILFFILRKTLKIAVRLFILGLILLIGIVGSLVIWFNLNKSSSKNPPTQKHDMKKTK